MEKLEFHSTKPERKELLALGISPDILKKEPLIIPDMDRQEPSEIRVKES